MVVTVTLQHYLDRMGVDYEVIAHPYADTGLDTAERAHIPANKLAKSIMLEDEGTLWGLRKGIPIDALLGAILPPVCTY